jgi:hypothetical protein
MSKKNQNNKPKTETPTDAATVDSLISIVPVEEIKAPSFEKVYEMVKNAKSAIVKQKENCDNREIHIALTDIDKNLSSALKNFKFIDMSLSAND